MCMHMYIYIHIYFLYGSSDHQPQKKPAPHRRVASHRGPPRSLRWKLPGLKVMGKHGKSHEIPIKTAL